MTQSSKRVFSICTGKTASLVEKWRVLDYILHAGNRCTAFSYNSDASLLEPL